jgi:hypothetical protein
MSGAGNNNKVAMWEAITKGTQPTTQPPRNISAQQPSTPPRKLNVAMQDRSGNIIGKIVVSPGRGIASFVEEGRSEPQSPKSPKPAAESGSTISTLGLPNSKSSNYTRSRSESSPSPMKPLQRIPDYIPPIHPIVNIVPASLPPLPSQPTRQQSNLAPVLEDVDTILEDSYNNLSDQITQTSDQVAGINTIPKEPEEERRQDEIGHDADSARNSAPPVIIKLISETNDIPQSAPVHDARPLILDAEDQTPHVIVNITSIPIPRDQTEQEAENIQWIATEDTRSQSDPAKAQSLSLEHLVTIESTELLSENNIAAESVEWGVTESLINEASVPEIPDVSMSAPSLNDNHVEIVSDVPHKSVDYPFPTGLEHPITTNIDSNSPSKSEMTELCIPNNEASVRARTISGKDSGMRERSASGKQIAMRERTTSGKEESMRERSTSGKEHIESRKSKRNTVEDERKGLTLETTHIERAISITIDTNHIRTDPPEKRRLSLEKSREAINRTDHADDEHMKSTPLSQKKLQSNTAAAAAEKPELPETKTPAANGKRMISLNASLKSYSNTANTTSAEDTPTGITDPWFLAFDSEKLEESYQNYFVSVHKPNWRLGLLIQLMLYVLIMGYHMLVYPADSDEFSRLRTTREALLANGTFAATATCNAGYVCNFCANGHLCNTFSFIHEALILGLGTVLPFALLYLISYSSFAENSKKGASIISAMYIVILLAVSVSTQHAVVEPSISPYKTAMLCVFSLFSNITLLRPKFLHVAAIVPLLLGIYIAEATTSALNFRQETSSLVISIATVIAAMIIACIVSHEYERRARLQFLKSQSSMNINEKLFNQLKDMHKNYSDRIVDFDSPLEKAIGMISLIRMDPLLNKEHFESMGVVLALLTSKDLMTPDIERQVNVGRVALDEEGEVS